MDTALPKYTVARYAIDAADGGLLPSVTDTLPLAEITRSALMAQYQQLLHESKFGSASQSQQERFYSATFSGKDAGGQPLKDHGHAYYLPTDEDSDGLIDHITVVTRAGFNNDEVNALDRLRTLRFGGDVFLQLLLVGLGRQSDVVSPLLAEAENWVSATPFVVTRFPKRRGRKKDQPESYATPQAFVTHMFRQELERFCQGRGDLTSLENITIVALERGIGVNSVKPVQFKRLRRKNADDSIRAVGAFRLQFPLAVRGPICLGHFSHFGLGLFVPE